MEEQKSGKPAVMWNDPKPVWRTARKEFLCQGDACTKRIAPGERYLDRSLRHPTHSHLRYCSECGPSILRPNDDFHALNGRNNFPERYQKHISGTQWKALRRQVIEQRGSLCERCGKESTALSLHHIHYRSLGSEQPEDVELLCAECHGQADEARATKGRARRVEPEEGWIVGPDGEHWGRLDPDAVYIPLPDDRYLPVPFKGKE